MFPESTELLLIGCSTESIWTLKSKSNTLTPKTNSQTYWPREISNEMNGIIFCFCLTLAISVLPIVLKWCRKEQEDAGEERVTAKSKPMMNLVSRCSVRTPDVLASTASESPGNTRYESQIHLSLWTEQQSRTGRPVRTLAHQTTQNGILRNLIKCWKQERWDLWVDNQPVRSLGTQTDLPLNTATESDFSLKPRSFLHRVNDRVRKMLDRSSKMQHKTGTNVL